ncbi:MAG: zinc ribbon domain-containing protein [Candidatus Rokubacteria bacterium]|nr:zinc ribbon domain-containing protein [Candidatus Rokubacteria bacterium]
MKCPRCQQENPTDARFCEDCGASLALICPTCRIEMTPGKRFCGSCGSPADTSAAKAGREIFERLGTLIEPDTVRAELAELPAA